MDLPPYDYIGEKERRMYKNKTKTKRARNRSHVQNVTKLQPCFPTSQPADYAPDALNDNSITESQRDN